MNKTVRIIFIGLLLLLAGIGVGYFAKKYFDTSESQPAVANDEQQPLEQVNPNPPESRQLEPETKPETKAVTEPNYDPAIWKIEHNGVSSYLFGSIHMGDQSMYPLPEHVRNAFSESEILVVEIDITNLNQLEIAQTVQQMAVTPDKSLKDQISQDTAAKYDEYCEKTRSPCQMFSSFEPWFAAMTLEALAMQQSGYSEKLGVDMHFLTEAKDSKTIVELESFESQLEMLDSMPAHLQDLMLLSAVTREDGSAEKILDAWKTGDIQSFMEESELSAKEQGISEEDYQAFADLILYQRNQGMADGIAELLEQGKSVFAVVGAAHYGGDKSVNYYLEQKGYKVTRL